MQHFKSFTKNYRMVMVFLALLLCFAQYHHLSHSFEHALPADTVKLCKDCLAAHDAGSGLGVSNTTFYAQLITPETQTAHTIVVHHELSFHQLPPSRAPPSIHV